LAEALRQTYAGISPALTNQLLEGQPELRQRPVQSLSDAEWIWLWQRWRAWLAAVERERFRFEPTPEGGFRCWSAEPASGLAEIGDALARPPLALNQSLAAYYGARLGRRRWLQAQAELRQRLQSALEREQRQLGQQQALLEAVPGNEELQQRAHALLSQPSPDRKSIDEAQALYRKARKLRRSLAAITPRLAQHQLRIEAMEASLTFLEQADSLEQLEELRTEIEAGERRGGRRSGSQAQGASQAQGVPRTQGVPRAQGAPQPLELTSPSGLRLQVGRNHRQNDWISIKQARRGDLWFHAQECPGSHVVLKASAGPAAEADLTAAADLAARFSRARGNARVPVLMVPVENLQRLPGTIAGTVRHRGGDVRWGEPGRAEVLLTPLNVPGNARP
jgi:predicted ribosome quality control (RQC) complex YloA/Tae2 family protein